jgi:hypothetical protein
MCLPVTPYKIEREWKHAGLSCAVVQAREAQNRCGYVRVPPGHPAHGRDYTEIEVSVHGGLTFAEIEPCREHQDGQGYWLGFDCAHYTDSMIDPEADPETMSQEGRKVWTIIKGSQHGHFWTQTEVERECESLAQQLATMK